MKHLVKISVAVCAVFASCSTSDGVLQLRKEPPAPIALVVEPMTAANGIDPIDWGGEFRDRLIRELAQLDAVSVVGSAEDAAARQGADFVLRPRLVRPMDYQHGGVSEGWWAAGGLWLVTWIGGLFVDDSCYSVEVEIAYDLRAGKDSAEPLGEVSSGYGGDDVDLAFFDRNDFFSVGTLMSLILPPFWTVDEDETTRQSLQDGVARRAAVKLAEYVKRDFGNGVYARGIVPSRLEVLQPSNGAAIEPGTLDLKLRISGTVKVSDVRIMRVDTGDILAHELGLSERNRPVGDGYELDLPLKLDGLVAGENVLRVEYATSVDESRTLRFTVK